MAATARIELFRQLSRGRTDVYQIRWESKNGKAGYAPACANEWQQLVCDTPRIKCADCLNRAFLPVTDDVIRLHLTGRITSGVYPLLADDRCHFLAMDFDGEEWREDATDPRKLCDAFGVPVAGPEVLSLAEQGLLQPNALGSEVNSGLSAINGNSGSLAILTMVTFRCARKFLQRARLTPSSALVVPSTRLGDWYATIVPFRSPLVLTLSEAKLLAVAVPLAPSNSLKQRWPVATREPLLALGMPADGVAVEVDAMRTAVVGVTTSRRILGCLNEAVARVRWSGAPKSAAECLGLSLRLSELIYSINNYESSTGAVHRVFGTRSPPKRGLH